MSEKPPRKKETLKGISGRAAEPRARKQGSASAKPLSSEATARGYPIAPARVPSFDLDNSQASEHYHDGWTIDRLKRRSSIPTAPSADFDTERISLRSPEQRTLKGLPRVSTQTSIPVKEKHGEAIDLVDRSRSSQIAVDMKEEMEELFSLGEFTGALRIAELVLGSRPDDKQALLCAENSRLRLEQQYRSKIGPLSQVPELDLGDAEIRWLGLDHRAGFVLSRIDGRSTVEELVDICGMSRLEFFKTLIELLNRGAIHFERR
ncbi:MAG: hypothetical protein JXA30_10110 [Deltaproteobacteria bacterium]|nr:hypothetical protein [Deltaproteobacteria bacterium]